MIDLDERPAIPAAGGDTAGPDGGGPCRRLAAARELAEGVCAGQLWRLGDDEVLDSVAAAYRLVATAQAAALAPLGEAVDRQPLDLGRARRTFAGPVRLALALRDRGCVHPGCDRPVRWYDDPWAEPSR